MWSLSKCEIFLIYNNNPDFNAISSRLNEGFPIKTIDPVNPQTDILSGHKIRFTILPCDFKCEVQKCVRNFIFISQNNDSLCLTARPLLLETPIYDNKLFHLSLFKECHFSDIQNYFLNKMKLLINNNSSSENPYHSTTSVSKVLQAQKYMLENPMKSHTLSSLAEKLNFSPSWLSSIFKRTSGISLSQFTKKIKLCNALWDLVSTEKQIKTIALDLGYKPLYFSNKFRTFFGIPPSDIRKNIFDDR